MNHDDYEQPTHRLPFEALRLLADEFDKLSRLNARGAARWATWWWWRCAWLLGLDPPGPEPTRHGLDTLSDGELVVLRDHFGHHRWACSPVHGLAAWCQQLVADMVDEFDRRLYERARIDAQFQIIAAEENRRVREAKPPPDLRGLPTWKEISSPQAE